MRNAAALQRRIPDKKDATVIDLYNEGLTLAAYTRYGVFMQLSLAPIQGMTTVHYRNSFNRHFGGIDCYYAPFVATAKVLKISPSLLKDLLPEKNSSNIKLIPQLLGNDGADFRRFAEAIQQYGYDTINWNIGCPYPTVTTKRKGAGLLPHYDQIDRVLDTALSGASYSLSVKMRLGMHSAAESERVIKVLNRYPLSEVIIHARTGVQAYDGTVDLVSFKRAIEQCSHSVTYNGDIFSIEDYIRIKESFPQLKGVMLGRGAMKDPFLPSEIKNSAAAGDKTADIKKFHDDLYEYYASVLSGGKHLCDKMKAIWEFLSVHIDHDGILLKKVRKCTSVETYDRIVEEFFAGNVHWKGK